MDIGGNIDHSLGDKVELSDFATSITSFKTLAMGLAGICAITCIIYFFISVTKLSTSAGNQMMRRKAIRGLLISGIGLMLFGGGSVVLGIMWGMLR